MLLTSDLRKYALYAAWPLAVVAFIAGCLAVQFQRSLPSSQTLFPWLAACVLLALMVVFASARLYGNTNSEMGSHPSKRMRPLAVLGLLLCNVLAGAALGGTWAAYTGASRVADGWPAAYEGVDMVATGYVANMPTLGTQSQRVQFVIESNDTDTALNGKTVLLSWYYGTFHLKPAQRYKLTFRAKQRHGGLNPGGFDYELWLVSRGIAATGYIRDKTGNQASAPQDLGSQSTSFLPQVERLRAHIRDRLFVTAPTPDAARWAAALALGDQRSLNDADWQRYNATGTGHLLAVSGTHITLMGALLAWLAARWWQAKPQRLLRLPVQTLRLNVMLVSSGFYALIAGWALPAQRTVLMLAVVWLSLRFMARPAVWHVMASSALVALAFDPMAVIAPSFWLSYGAVAVLIAVELRAVKHGAEPTPDTLHAPASAWAQRWQAFKRLFHSHARSQLLLTLALVPLGAVFFNQISVVSPLANAVAIPVMGWVSTPIALIAALLSLLWGGMAAALMQALLAVQQGMDAALDALLMLPFAQLRVPTAPPAWAVFGLLAAVGCAFLQAVWRWISVVGVLAYVGGAFVLASMTANTPQAWRVAFLDVGQGAAVAVHSQGKTLLFDTGPRYSADSDGAARVIVPYLQAAGVQQLDHVILSHADEDHTGGTRSLLARMPVAQWWHSLSAAHPLLAALPASKLPCEAGKRLHWAGLTLHWLHPPTGIEYDDHKTNAVSCVLRISDTDAGGTTTVLLTGDIEAEQEAELIARNPDALKATVLLAPHHGSKTSSTPAFLQAVKPQHTIMQNGYRNRYGHPHPSVSQRYADAGITQWRSDADGAVLLDVHVAGYALSAWRAQAQRYWHTVLPAATTLRATADGQAF